MIKATGSYTQVQ